MKSLTLLSHKSMLTGNLPDAAPPPLHTHAHTHTHTHTHRAKTYIVGRLMIDRGWDLSVREGLIAPCPLPAWKEGWLYHGEKREGRSQRKDEWHLHHQFPPPNSVSAWVMRRSTEDTGGRRGAKTDSVVMEEVKRGSRRGGTVLKGCRTGKALLLPSPRSLSVSSPLSHPAVTSSPLLPPPQI